MSDRIVYVCGCVDGDGDGISTTPPPNETWHSTDVWEGVCLFCKHPVAAINIDHLERIKKAAERAVVTHRLVDDTNDESIDEAAAAIGVLAGLLVEGNHD